MKLNDPLSILSEVTKYRRSPPHRCENLCEKCLAPHLPKVMSAMVQHRPITFVLPAFPGKSPNLAKVLGPLPDMAEVHSLRFLQKLCTRIESIYEPGAQIILCSDGRVFSDVVGIEEDHVSAYQQELARVIKAHSLPSLSLFNLDDVFKNMSFQDMRGQLLLKHGRSLEVMQSMVKEDPETQLLYCGLTRFLFEDSLHPERTKSKSAIQREARMRAYEVIQRSNAWSELIAERFPDAVRLSIHSQICGSQKLGIRLLEENNLMTPWHGVAVDIGGKIEFMKRTVAEALGGEMIFQDGRPSHFKLEERTRMEIVC